MNNIDTRYALVNDVTKNHMTIQRISSYRAALELPNAQAQIIVYRIRMRFPVLGYYDTNVVILGFDVVTDTCPL